MPGSKMSQAPTADRPVPISKAPVRRADAATAPAHNPSESRLAVLDGLRGIAALAVVIEHLRNMLFPASLVWPVWTYVNLGRAGVMLFFLISGFVIPLSLERSGSLAKFWHSRIFRLFPAYWLTIAVSLISFAFGISVIDPAIAAQLRTGHGLWPMLANLAMVQFFVGVHDFRGVFWTLDLELVFYLVISALFLLKWNRDVVRLTYASAILLALSGLASLALHHRLPIGGLTLVLVTSVGLLAYRLREGQISPRQTLAPIVAFSAALLFAAWVGYVRLAKGQATDVPFPALLTSYALSMAVFWSACQWGKILQSPAMAWLGRISYSVYLLHVSVIAALGFLPPIPRALLALVLILSTAELSYKYVEQPGVELGRRLWARRACARD
jgi:peptidoglycan/LPS O-acetylase OafA/YrhL